MALTLTASAPVLATGKKTLPTSRGLGKCAPLRATRAAVRGTRARVVAPIRAGLGDSLIPEEFRAGLGDSLIPEEFQSPLKREKQLVMPGTPEFKLAEKKGVAGLSSKQIAMFGLEGETSPMRPSVDPFKISARAAYRKEIPSEQSPPASAITAMAGGGRDSSGGFTMAAAGGMAGAGAGPPPDLPSLLPPLLPPRSTSVDESYEDEISVTVVATSFEQPEVTRNGRQQQPIKVAQPGGPPPPQAADPYGADPYGADPYAPPSPETRKPRFWGRF